MPDILLKNVRNTATTKMRQEEKLWEENKLNDTKHDPSTLWSSVKSWLSWGNSGPPSKLSQDGMIITSPARLAWTMNDFFIRKVREQRARIPHSETDPLGKLKDVLRTRQCTFGLRPVTPDEVSKIIQNLKNSKSTGTDFINTWTVKLVSK